MKSKDLQPRLLYPAKPSFRTKGQIKTFPDKKMLKVFIATNSFLFEILKDFLIKIFFYFYTEEKRGKK